MRRPFARGLGSHLAALGLVSILLLCIGCGLWMGMNVQRTSDDAHLHLLSADHYRDARVTLTAETAVWDVSWARRALPKHQRIARSAASISGALEDLVRLDAASDDPYERSAVASILRVEQRRFRRAMRRLDAALAHRNVARALAIDGGVMVPLLAVINRTIVAAAERERAETMDSLHMLDSLETLTRFGGGLLFLGLLLSVVWFMRLRSHAAVRASDARKSAIVAAALDAIVTVDGAGHIVEFNPAAEHMFGYSALAVVGEDMANLLIPPALRERYRQEQAHLLVPEQDWAPLGQRRELTAMRADGSAFPIELAVTQLPTRGPALFTAFIRDISARQQAEEALRANEALLRTIYATVACGIVVQDAHGAILYGNEAAERILGLTLDQMGGRTSLDPRWRATREDGSDFPGAEHPAMVALRTGVEQREVMMGVALPGGERHWIQVDAVPVIDEAGVPVRVVCSFTDVSERKRMTEVLRETAQLNSQLATAVDNLTTGVLITDARQPDQPIIFVNLGFTALTGYTSEEVVGQTSYLLRGPETDPATLQRVLEARIAGQPLTAVIRSYRRDGTSFWNELRLNPIRDEDGHLTHVVSLLTDVSARVQMEDELRHQALHDTLTDLPNRALLYDRLEQGVRSVQRDHAPLALLLLDIDRFKEINDTFGHDHGDLLLRQVAERLRGVLRATDTVARLGGDEFALLLPLTDRAGAVTSAEMLCRALDAPFIVEGQALQVGGSIGIVLCPEHGLEAQALLRRADIAMYIAKRAETCYAVYAPEQDEHSPERLALIGELRQAIAHDELRLHFQPQLDLTTGLVCGVEALVRWPHPTRGMIPPDQFIPLAERTGLIAPLTRWVMDAALRGFGQCHISDLALPISVNLSTANLLDPQLPDTVATLLQSHDVPPQRLRFEVTESMLLADTARAEEVLVRLAALGVGLSIDDFGTGYSSLAYLKRLPVDELKIDKSFVRHMADDSADAAIVASTIGLAHSLGLRVVAEGVEDQVTWETLARLGCDIVQGYYLSRPLSALDLSHWLQTAARAA